MADFDENLIDGPELTTGAVTSQGDVDKAGILVNSFYLQTIAKGIKAVYLQQEEILKRLPTLPPYEGGHHA